MVQGISMCLETKQLQRYPSFFSTFRKQSKRSANKAIIEIYTNKIGIWPWICCHKDWNTSLRLTLPSGYTLVRLTLRFPLSLCTASLIFMVFFSLLDLRNDLISLSELHPTFRHEQKYWAEKLTSQHGRSKEKSEKRVFEGDAQGGAEGRRSQDRNCSLLEAGALCWDKYTKTLKCTKLQWRQTAVETTTVLQ